ncbi:DUF4198 domain-containing protein [Nocardioidaceae bacterium]|nr:DUF4198 domain-containing protein [Nocardioidaceae bacterium]
MRRVREVVVAAACAVAVTATVGACSSDVARVVGESSVGGLGPTAGPGTGDLLVTGRVLDDGEPLEGATVSVLVYPARPDPAATGPTVSVEVPRVTTTESGRFAVTLPAAEVPGEYLAPLPDGSPRLEFAVVVDDGSRVSSYPEIAALVAAGGSSPERVWRSPGGTGEGSVLRLTVDLGEQTATVTDSDGSSETTGVPSR